jgi:sulfatase maturation enzyme AslB (radical SAM superfamily)
MLHQPKTPRMSESMLELHIKQYIEAQTGNEVVFSWQGGEPTLWGRFLNAWLSCKKICQTSSTY